MPRTNTPGRSGGGSELSIRVRPAGEADFPRIFEIEKRSYPPPLNTRHAVLRYRNRVFGIWVAELDGRVAGFNTCVPVRLRWTDPDLEGFRRNRTPHYLPWFEQYERERAAGQPFNCLLNSSSAVETQYQRRGVGTALVENSLQVAREHGLAWRVSALRCEFARYFRETGRSIEDYIRAVADGEVRDRFLSLYRRLGFVFAAPLPDYEPDRGSLNYCVFTYKAIE